jgi:hypothetical protein
MCGQVLGKVLIVLRYLVLGEVGMNGRHKVVITTDRLLVHIHARTQDLLLPDRNRLVSRVVAYTLSIIITIAINIDCRADTNMET